MSDVPYRELCWETLWKRFGPGGPYATVVLDREDLPVAGFHTVIELEDGFLAICSCRECLSNSGGALPLESHQSVAHCALILGG